MVLPFSKHDDYTKAIDKPLAQNATESNVKITLPLGLYGIINLKPKEDPFPLLTHVLTHRVKTIQIRSKNSPDLTENLLQKLPNLFVQVEHHPIIIVNDYLQLALDYSIVNGLHIGQTDISPEEARRQLGPNKLIGLSTHSLADIDAANLSPIDYIGFGPIYTSSTKSGHAPTLGIKQLQKAVQHSKHPVVAIGGITAENHLEVLSTKTHCIATVNALAELASN